jgi:hypothetical protein
LLVHAAFRSTKLILVKTAAALMDIKAPEENSVGEVLQIYPSRQKRKASSLKALAFMELRFWSRLICSARLLTIAVSN